MAGRPAAHQIAKSLRYLLVRLADSPLGAQVVRIGPVAWLTRRLARTFVLNRLDQSLATPEAGARSASADLELTFKAIVHDVVDALGYRGALIATYDPDGSLPIKAWHLDPALVSEQQVQDWEAQIAHFSTRSISFAAGQPVVSSRLIDLFPPLVPQQAQTLIQGIQDALGVREVLAVPFFLETAVDGASRREFAGNLFVLATHCVEPREQRVLAAVGRQAAAAILSDRRRAQTQAVLRLIFDIQTNLKDEGQILQQIVEGVVNHMAYIGAFVATYEADGALAVQAWHFDPAVATRSQVHSWEAQIAQLSPGRPISLDPTVARVYVDRAEYRENLSARAFYQQRPVATSELYDLFRPIVPPSALPLVRGIQDAILMRQAIAVPFFLPEQSTGEPSLLGNLFALSRAASFSSAEIEVLKAFGQQAAAGLHNAQLYRQAESRRKAAEIFGKMAFTAAASVHELKNRIGVVRGNLQVLKILPPEQLIELRSELSEPVFRNLDQIADLLDSLHEPWQQLPDTLLDINACLNRALAKVLQGHERNRITIERDLAVELPLLAGSHDMMIETFKVLLKNALEAITERGSDGRITLKSTLCNDKLIEVVISDNGSGIRPEHLTRVFEMRWSTKQDTGLGFGLFWAHDYIAGLGGSISVASTYGEGTSFTLRLPCEQQAALVRGEDAPGV